MSKATKGGMLYPTYALDNDVVAVTVSLTDLGAGIEVASGPYQVQTIGPGSYVLGRTGGTKDMYLGGGIAFTEAVPQQNFLAGFASTSDGDCLVSVQQDLKDNPLVGNVDMDGVILRNYNLVTDTYTDLIAFGQIFVTLFYKRSNIRS